MSRALLPAAVALTGLLVGLTGADLVAKGQHFEDAFGNFFDEATRQRMKDLSCGAFSHGEEVCKICCHYYNTIDFQTPDGSCLCVDLLAAPLKAVQLGLKKRETAEEAAACDRLPWASSDCLECCASRWQVPRRRLVHRSCRCVRLDTMEAQDGATWRRFTQTGERLLWQLARATNTEWAGGA